MKNPTKFLISCIASVITVSNFPASQKTITSLCFFSVIKVTNELLILIGLFRRITMLEQSYFDKNVTNSVA
jgi:hypothetical protein